MSGAPDQEPAPVVDVGAPPTPAALSPIEVLQAFDADAAGALEPTLAALRQLHGGRYDSTRFRFIESLSERIHRHRPVVAERIAARAGAALAGHIADYLGARRRAAQLAADLVADNPGQAARIRELAEAGDFPALQRLAARLRSGRRARPGPLARLLQDIRQADRDGTAVPDASFDDELRRQEREIMGGAAGNGGSPGPDGTSELRAMRQLRNSLIRRQGERRVERAIEQGPANPGPLNAESLIVRSLGMMRDLSPAYAERIVAYLDTLLRLEQAAAAAPSKPKSKASARRKG